MILSVYSNGDKLGEGPSSFAVISVTARQADAIAKQRLGDSISYGVERIIFREESLKDNSIVVVADSYYTSDMYILTNVEKEQQGNND